MEQVLRDQQYNQRKQTTLSKYIPKGCYQPQQQQKYIGIKNFLQIKDFYHIVCPFKYNVMGFVVVRKKDHHYGWILELFHEVSKKSILKAVPKSGQIGAKYAILCSDSGEVVARVRGDLMASKFFIFDGGYNPSRKKFPTRKEIGYAYLSNNDFFSSKPSSLTVILGSYRKRTPDQSQLQNFGIMYESEGLPQLEQNTSQLLKCQSDNLKTPKSTYSITSVQPSYCSTRKGYVMDLKGLITEASKTNMIMKTSTNQECFVMGKRAENSFYLFYGGPLTLLQAFGIFIINYLTRKD